MNLSQWEGSWAVVTGASAGIGQEFARQLAQRKINVVLVARRGDLLKSLADELKLGCGVDALPIELDLAQAHAARSLHAAVKARGVEPRLLVNNAGVGRWGRFEDTDIDTYARILAVNTTCVAELCRFFLPDLAERPPSAIINVSSPAALQPVPFMAAYAASKAFVHSLSLALHEEWRERGVYVQTLIPGPTATEFDTLAGAYSSQLGSDRCHPAHVVRTALAGFVNEQPLVAAASGIYLQKVFAAVAPVRFVIGKVGRMFQPPNSGRS